VLTTWTVTAVFLAGDGWESWTDLVADFVSAGEPLTLSWLEYVAAIAMSDRKLRLN
jgi:hypothetical protein